VHPSYRLGPFGFLTSATLREAGYLPNNGLHDQKLGLRWVKKYIEGFGGDPARITLLGCSIGGGKPETKEAVSRSQADFVTQYRPLSIFSRKNHFSIN